MYNTKLTCCPRNVEIESPSLRMTKFSNIPRKQEDEESAKRSEIGKLVACINSRQLAENAWRSRAFNESRGVTFTAELGARMIVNSNGGVLENAGLCLHRNFGFPFIPGSAVKGIARHAAWCDWKEGGEDTKARAIAEVFGYPTNDAALDEALKSLIGEMPRGGKVVFFEANPEQKALTEVDILNSHHMEYYGGEREVALDNENPNLCYFPVVREGTAFVFNVQRRSDLSDADFKLAVKWLKTGLSCHGIGAKTAAGYGWFDIPEDKTDVEMDGTFLSEMEALYLKDGKIRGEAFKKDYKKGKIIADSDGKKRAFCQFVVDHRVKVGGEWQKEIDRMLSEFGLEVL